MIWFTCKRGGCGDQVAARGMRSDWHKHALACTAAGACRDEGAHLHVHVEARVAPREAHQRQGLHDSDATGRHRLWHTQRDVAVHVHQRMCWASCGQRAQPLQVLRDGGVGGGQHVVARRSGLVPVPVADAAGRAHCLQAVRHQQPHRVPAHTAHSVPVDVQPGGAVLQWAAAGESLQAEGLRVQALAPIQTLRRPCALTV
jgi:hypothetical protein